MGSKNRRKTKQELIGEIESLKQRVSELEEALAEQRRSEESLRERETQLRAIFEAATEVGLIVSDLGGTNARIREFGPGAENIFGYRREEVIGRPVAMLHLPEEVDRFPAVMEAMRACKEGFTAECDLVRKSGERFAAIHTTHPILDEHGEAVASLSVTIDVSALKRAEEGLRQSERKFRTIFENANDMIAYLDEFGRFVDVNRRVEDVLGWRPEEVVGKHFLQYDFVDEATLHDLTGRFFEVGRTGVPSPVSFWAMRKDGVPMYLEASSAILEGEDGRKAILAIIRDVTQRKQAELRLDHLNSVLRSIRDVNALIVSERAPNRLASGACERLTQNHGYRYAWIVLFDSSGDLDIRAQAGCEADFGLFVDEFEQGRTPPCCRKALAQPGVIEIADADLCTGCSLEGEHETAGMMLVRLAHGETVYGILAVCMSGERVADAEERRLLAELAADISLALDDIEVQKKQRDAEQLLRESERRYRALVENATEVIFSLDTGGNFTYISPIIEPLSGYSVREIIGTNFAMYIVPEDLPGLLASFERTIEGEKEPYEFRVRCKDGSVRHVTTSSSPVMEQGRPVGLIGVMTDITGRHQMEQALRRSEERYRLHFENVSDVLFSVAPDLTITSMSPSVERVLGYKPEELVGQVFPELDLFAPESRQRAVENTRRVFAGEPATSATFEFITKDGSRRFGEISSAPVYQDGVIVSMISVARDVTEKKLAQDALVDSEEKFRTIFENANDGIVYLDAAGTVIDANGRLEEMFGYARQEVIGKNFQEVPFLDPEILPALVAQFRESLDGRVVGLMELEVKRKDGTPVFIEASTRTVPSSEAGGSRILAVIRDITERKRAEDAAAKARALEEIDRLKTALLASVSHEIRTPLTSIKGMAGTLLQRDVKWDEETQREFLTAIDRASDKLTRIVSDLIDLSQLEVGVIRLEKVRTRIFEVVNQVKDELEEAARNHDLAITVSSDLPEMYADEVRIGQVITNLVSNAAAYSEPGTRVSVTAELKRDDIQVSVADQGVGIAEDELGKVFDRFYRLESGASRRRGGSGLGLAICRGIIEAHGGGIWVESQVGHGSTFRFTLPIAECVDCAQS